MKTLSEIIASHKILIEVSGSDGGQGWLHLDPKRPNKQARVVWSNGGGWDHVSVSWSNRCPTWEEMCRVKDVFFRKDETCIEYHPAEENYVNYHPYCLHIWKPQKQELPLPPTFMIGPKDGQSKSDALREAAAYLGA